MDLGLAGKRAIVTGGSRGIGFATAAALCDEGVDVVLGARTQADLNQSRDRLQDKLGRVLARPVDTADPPSVERFVRRAVSDVGGLDILVNAAAVPGIQGSTPALADLRDEDLRQEMETKLLGYLRTARAAAPVMASVGWGRIINVSGLAARSTGSTFGSIRNVAVAALTKNLADELGPLGINVTAVHPGLTVTERTPSLIAHMAESQGISPAQAQERLASRSSIGRMVTAEEVAAVIVFLASPRSVAINGDAIPVGGGTPGVIHY